jgi:hypothetical protein
MLKLRGKNDNYPEQRPNPRYPTMNDTGIELPIASRFWGYKFQQVP